MSDSSTISSGTTPRQRSPQDSSYANKENRNAIGVAKSNGKVTVKVEDVQKEGPFVRSLSVIKPKKAPPPPSRSYSLHNKMKRRSRDLAGLAEVSTIPAATGTQSNSAKENEWGKSGSSPMPSKIVDSPGYNADTSSLEDSSASVSFSPIRSQLQGVTAGDTARIEPKKEEVQQPSKLHKLASPSSGYSSQEGTAALLSIHGSSTKHKRGIFAKFQRFFPGSSPPPPASPVTMPMAQTPEITKSKVSSGISVDTVNISPSVRTLIELFNIPPHPKVHAPPPPPPEVWAHSKRSFELLLGPPAPDNLYAIIKKNPKDRRQQRKSSSTSSDGSVHEKKHRNHNNEPINGLEAKKGQDNAAINADIPRESIDRRAEQNVELKGNRQVTEVDGKVRVSDILNVMLVKAVERRDERLAAVQKENAQKVASSMDRLPVISLVRNPPSPSPPPTHSPPIPPGKKTAEGSSVSSDQALSPEICWPPPPPPVGLSGADDFEFPLPPPPVFGDDSLVLPVQVPPSKLISGGDMSSPSMSASPGVKIDCLRVTKEAEPPITTSSKGIVPSLHIPPPPPYTAPPPPIKTVSAVGTQNVTPPPTKASLLPSKVIFTSTSKVSPLPPLIEVTSSPPTEFCTPPIPKELSPPPLTQVPITNVSPEEVLPQPPAVVTFPPAPQVPCPPMSKVIIIPPPKEVSPPAAVVSVHPPSPKEVSTATAVVSIPLPNEVNPPPAVVSVPSAPPNDVSPPPTVNSTPSPPPKEILPQTAVVSILPLPPTEISILAPLSKEAFLTPPDVISIPPQSVEISTPSPNKGIDHSITEDSPRTAEEVTLSSIQRFTVSTEEVSLPSVQVNTPPISEVVKTEEKLSPQQSEPSPPPLEPSVQETNLSNFVKISESETNPVPFSSILTPPTSIPPPPPINISNQAQHDSTSDTTDSPNVELDLHSPESKPVPVTAEIFPEPALSAPVSSLLPSNVQNSTTTVVQKESNPVVNQAHLTTVELQSSSSSPEPPQVEEQPQTEVIMRKKKPDNQVPPSSCGEAPQKPIRKSLIITSPTSTSPPTSVALPSLPKSQSLVIPPVSTVASPTKKSPPAMTAMPSMNLQEAIRLRTAARSVGGSAPRLGLHSPPSPKDIHKSPSSTASFIFSKSNKKMAIETKSLGEAKAVTQKNSELSPVNKSVFEAELVQKDVKLPPPVAKKPKMKGKDTEGTEKNEHTAGQEELPENIMGKRFTTYPTEKSRITELWQCFNKF